MELKTLIHGLWYAQIAIQCVVACVLIAKRVWEKFPSFSAYVLVVTGTALLKLAVSGNGRVYFYTYWICEVIAIVLGLFVVREIFMNLFAPHRALRKLATLCFRVAVVMLVIMGCVVIYVQSPGAQGITKTILIGEEATRVVEVGLIMFLFLASSAFGLHWRQNVFGIALGLGIFTAVELVALAMRLHFGSGTLPAFSIARILAFELSLLVWLGYMLAPERATSNVEVPKQSQLEQWNQAIMELISQ